MNELPDVGHGVEPDVAGLSVRNQLGQRVQVRHLIPIGISHLMSGEDEPPMVLDRSIKLGLHLGEGEIVQAGSHQRGEVADGRVIGGFVQIAAAGHEALRDQRYIALRIGPAADKFLSARVGEADRLDAEGGLDFVGGGIEILRHFGERVVFQSLILSERVITGARVCLRMVRDFMARFESGLPGFQPLRIGRGKDVESTLDFELIEEGDAGIDLGVAGVIERQRERGRFIAGPLEGFGLSGEGSQQKKSACHGIIGSWLRIS
jgi:hypothetical protein